MLLADPRRAPPFLLATWQAGFARSGRSGRIVLKVRRSNVQGHPAVSYLGHDFSVATQLDEVADRLAQQPLAVRHSSNRLLAYADERQGLVGIIAFVVGAVGMAVSVFRRYPRVPDQLTTRRLYEQATGVDRDRANADLALVADRLAPLVNAPDPATITFEAVDGTDVLLVEELSHDPTGELFDAYRQAFDACVGEEWEQTGRDGAAHGGPPAAATELASVPSADIDPTLVDSDAA